MGQEFVNRAAGFTSSFSGASRVTKALAFGAAVSAFALFSATASAATITVNSLLDDVFPDATGAIFDVGGSPIVLASSKCTLRMAIAAANLDVAVGGTNGCAKGDSETSNTTPFAQPNGLADQIVFTSGLTGTININVSKKMSEAPAVFLSFSGVAAPNLTSALVVSRPLVINGNQDANGVATIALDGGLLTNPAADGRLILFSDGNAETDSSMELYALKFQNARITGSSGACLFSRESLRMSRVVFDNCVSEGTTTGVGFGGAMGIFATRNGSLAVPNVRPNLIMLNSTVQNSKALQGTSTTSASAAGGIAIGSATGYVGNVYIFNSKFLNNSAQSFGGLYIRNAAGVIVDQSQIDNNQANGLFNATAGLNGGFFGGASIRSVFSASITNTTFNGNLANQATGGLEVSSATSLTMLGSQVNGNTVGVVGATVPSSVGGATISAGRINISTSSFSNNTVNSPANVGGGNAGGLRISNASGGARLLAVEVNGNTVNNGSTAGLSVSNNGDVEVEGVTINGNTTTKSGAIFAGNAAFSSFSNTSLLVLDSTFSNNVSADFGVINMNASFKDRVTSGTPAVTVAANPLPPTDNTVTFTGNTVSNNTSTDSIVYMESPGVYVVINSTIANNNVTAGCGGGLRADAYNPYMTSTTNAFQLVVSNSTVTRNTVSVCQSALAVGSYDGANNPPSAFNGSVIVESSILGKEFVGSTKDVLWLSNPSKLTISKSIIEDAGGSAIALCGTNGLLCNTDPLLDALGSNGGPTKTMRPKTGSPAINAGSNTAGLSLDQRGATRVVAGVADMGAYETSAVDAVANCSLDMDGVGGVQAMKEGVVMLRSMLGFNDSAAVNGTGISSTQWATTKNNLNTNCGTNGNFAP